MNGGERKRVSSARNSGYSWMNDDTRDVHMNHALTIRKHLGFMAAYCIRVTQEGREGLSVDSSAG
ncbi:hypothetical protein GCM10008957_35570 [Deinococcus ruber]|uniref:Uncharacterized protein n=1 Tax=Deinococcus ruber TaxID=1848197 RepID=A0A918FBS8_9DEIO|nr:hypothetical protein GCM10008957_35570 [Deinococcus ruber]